MSDGRMFLSLLFVLVFGGLYVAVMTHMFQLLIWYCFGWDWYLWADILMGFISAVISAYLGLELIVIVFDD